MTRLEQTIGAVLRAGVIASSLALAAGLLFQFMNAPGAQWLLHAGALLSPAMAASSPRIAGAILIGAGLYQLTPLKNMCLTHCRSPIDFLMSHWRGGRAGPIRMGVHHGLYCLGCCWALMAVLFAVGVMNLLWVAGLALLVLVEKMMPATVLVSRMAGAALLIAGAIKMVSNA